MQAATTCFVQPFCPPKSALKAKDFAAFTRASPPKPTTSRATPVRAALSFNYNSSFSVFPAEACETIGGDSCPASMFPEAKLEKPGLSRSSPRAVEEFDREYFDYDSEPNSVLRAEACDDLGGEFCASS